MKLKEKFNMNSLTSDVDLYLFGCEKIAEEFAMGFGNWLVNHQNQNKLYNSSLPNQIRFRLPMKDILEIYKKENGL